MALCAFYYYRFRRRIPFTFFYHRFCYTILIGTVLVSAFVLLISLIHGTGLVNGIQKRLWIMQVMLFATVFAIPLLIEKKESSGFEEVLLIICCAFAIQGVISFAAYIYPPLSDLLMKLKPEGLREIDADVAMSNKFRYYNLSGILLVELTAGFGVAFVVFFWMQLRYNHPYMKGWRKYIIFLFIFLGTVFSGRTGFFGFLFGLMGFVYFSFSRVFKLFRRNINLIVIFTALILFSYYYLLNNRQRQSFNDEIFPFAFEWYYNYKDYGKFEVSSMEATSLHYFYLSDETLLLGHGVQAYDKHNPYPHSDAGYMNNLIFGGIPLLLCLITYQCLYTALPLFTAQKNRSREGRIDRLFFLILFVYIFFVEIKAPALGTLHIVEVMYIAVGATYVYNSYLQRRQSIQNK